MRLARLVLLVTWCAAADTSFTVRRMLREDVPLGKGQCDIRLQIDGEAEVSLEGDRVHIRTISGRDGYDDGSECNFPLPRGRLEGFQFEVKDKRNEIRLLDEPSPRNGFRTVVAIRDSSGGQGRYHFRVSWDRTSGGGGRQIFPPSRQFGADTVEFTGSGSGSLQRRVVRTTVRVHNGNVSATFDGRFHFTGQVTRTDRDVIYADVRDQDAAPAQMTITLDSRGGVRSVTVNGDRVSLDWRR